jgi:hypothetical protein
MIELKRKLYDHCVKFIDKRIDTAREAIRIAQESANDETKSSAGDKYETGRAMMQLEIEKNMMQLQEALKQKEILESIDLDRAAATIQLGSLAVTDDELFFIAISLGLQVIDKNRYAIISPSTPIGKNSMDVRLVRRLRLLVNS